jgi:putative FmdB family regulatory protein
MPLYEYVCSDCDRRFETLVTRERQPACPSCQGTNLQKQLSVFAVSTGGSTRTAATVPMGGCGTCGDPRGPGACSMN